MVTAAPGDEEKSLESGMAEMKVNGDDGAKADDGWGSFGDDAPAKSTETPAEETGWGSFGD